jgi:hypothetical protein
MKVMVRGEIRWEPHIQEFIFRGAVMLPAEDGFLPPVLRCPKKIFFGSPLTPAWGDWDPAKIRGSRFKEVCITGKTMKEVKEKLREEVEKEIAGLRKVKRENEEKMKERVEVEMEYDL